MLRVKKSTLQGKLLIPPSKSQTMRALLFGSLGEGKTRIYHYLKSPDTQAMIQAFCQFGVKIVVEEKRIEIMGVGGKLQACDQVIDAGNSGQVLRFVGCCASLLPSYTILTGDHSIRNNRPVEPLLSALTQLKGFAVSSRLDGKAPIIIRGPIEPGVAELAGDDSQPVSGLLMAASFLHGTTHLKVTNPGEKPWIDLTLSWLKRLGGRVSHQNYSHYTISGPIRYKGFDTLIGGDFSSAAFPMIAALITGSTLTLENVDMGEEQGDKKIIAVLIQMGAHFEIDHKRKRMTLCKSSPLIGRSIDCNDLIDALPILAVVGCFAEGRTEITHARIARKKESDRIHAITLELRKMGALIEEREDGLVIHPSPLHGARVFSHQDHRIALALIVAALGARGDSYIEGGECIAKSYPSFVLDFQKIGALIEYA
jgi:3-phosphoshikimate 1-carboxyvinyltransferase